ncbi:MAG: hypothetical protein Q8R38_03075 [Candidatus Omnitrophota bacterium]|nr:hypothetical protein [Candidatus Omnitrophota bacterium]
MMPKAFIKKCIFLIKFLSENKPFLILAFDFKFMVKRIINRLSDKRILFYPSKPHASFVITKICYLLGYKRTNSFNDKYNSTFNWEDATYRTRYESLVSLSNKTKVVNILCNNISKRKVMEVFNEVFGYNIGIDPLIFSGKCVKKSNLNAKHDGKIIECPIDVVEDEFVYQKLVNNSTDEGFVEDIRLPIFYNSIPFVYLKRRPMHDRFGNNNLKVKVTEVKMVISNEEKNKILLFCNKIGLDYGELDAARDSNDKRLYIFDVNATPFGPPNHIAFWDYFVALKKLAENFEKMLALA